MSANEHHQRIQQQHQVAPPTPPPQRNNNQAGNSRANQAAQVANHQQQPSNNELVPINQEQNYNWQISKRNLRERFEFLFNNEALADVHFIVGVEQHRIPAHKLVLSAGSAVFDALFNGGIATTETEIKLPDVEHAAFLALLRFLYTDEVRIGPETVMTTLYTAKKYAVPALEVQCVEFLEKNLRPDNAFMLLTQARLFDEPQLAQLCLECIDHNTSQALTGDGFTDIDYETLCTILRRDSLGIREHRVFAALVRWAEAECARQAINNTSENKRRVLKEAAELVRYSLMTVEEFAAGPAQSDLLKKEEVVEIFLHFTVNPKVKCFNDTLTSI